MTLEELEFAITQYLDGTLPAEERGALEARLASDPQAAALFGEQERLTALLRSEPLPELDWAEVARDLSAVVTGSVDERSRAEDQKLNAILKAASPLPEIRWEALSRQISAAVAAGATAEDGKLDELLRSVPTPALNWDWLAGHLSDAVAQVARGEEADERPAVIGRIGWVRKISSLAVAACVLVATGLGLRAYLGGGQGGTPSGPSPAPTALAVVEIETPRIEKAGQPAVAEISIGPSKAYASAENDGEYNRGVASRSPVVILTPADTWEEWDSSVPTFE